MRQAAGWPGRSRGAVLVWLMAMLAMLVVPVAFAQRVEGERAAAQGVYEAEVPVNSQSDADRNNGFARALVQVLAKVTGDRNASAKAGVGEELRRAREYVSGYDFRQDESAGPSGATRFRTMLVARFDKGKVDRMIGELGLGVWPQPRPKPVLWLAIDDGKGPRLVGLAQNNAARPVLDRAIERGFRLGLPSGNAAEQAAVGAIWRGDTGAIARLSSRYSPPMQLIGKLYRSGAGWKADWVFVDSGKVQSKWSTTNSDARRAMSGGADGTADALIRRYARRGTATAVGPSGSHRVLFTGIDSADDYIRLSSHLQGLSVVRRIRPIRATSEGLLLQLDLSTGMQGFKRAIQEKGVLVPVEGGDVATFSLR